MSTSWTADASAKLHILHVFPTFAVGGAQRRFAELARLLAKRYRHTIIALDGNFDMAARLSSEAEFATARVNIEKKRHLANVPILRRMLKRYAPHALVTYNWGSIEWALANRWKPVARHIHIEDGFGPEEKARQLPRRVWTRRVALSGAQTRIVVPSRGLFDIARKQWRLPEASIRYIPNGIDCKRFAPRPRNAASSAIVIGTIAALRPEKNIARLVETFSRARNEMPAVDLRLAVFGEGPERARLESLAQQLHVEEAVSFRGETSNPETALGELDVFAITSDTEQMPLSVLEAMAASLPIAAVSVGDVSTMISEENRHFSTPLGDDGALAKSLVALAKDPLLRERLGSANRQAALERFDLNLMAARYGELFG